MKVIINTTIFFLFFLQTLAAQVVTVLNIDTKGVNIDPVQMGNIVRLELDKLYLFEVTDKYDIRFLVDEKQIENCYGKTCTMEIGRILGSDKMLTGSVEKFGETINLNLKLINVKTGEVEKNYIKEYLNFPNEIQRIVRLSLRDIFGLENEEILVQSLTQKETFENPINQPNVNRLRLDGPRMGITTFTGRNAEIIKAPSNEGGFNMFPVMFQFGYQFEVQYLNEGYFQSLLEFIPMITGLDQGMVIPSFTILNGLRNNYNGFEIAFGPTFGFLSVADGYYGANGQWRLAGEGMPPEANIERRMDSRGFYTLRTGFVIAFGRSFRSGKLNLPVNGYIIPNRDGMRVGLSFGFNARN